MKPMKTTRRFIHGLGGEKQLPFTSLRAGGAGFSIVEMILSAATSLIVILAASIISISETKASIKLYVLQGLRDKYARITYFIEGEVSEADNLSVTDDAACTAPQIQGIATPATFLFSFRHRYVVGNVVTCLYNVPLVDNPDAADPNDWAIYRFGPAIGDQTGVIGGVAGTDANIPADLNPGPYVLAPYAFIASPALNNAANCGASGFPGVPAAIAFACDGKTLTYVLNLGTGSKGRASIWNATYSSSNKTLFLRTRSR